MINRQQETNEPDIPLKVLQKKTMLFFFFLVWVIFFSITVFSSFGKIEFWVYNKTNKPVKVTSCSFGDKKLSSCPQVIINNGEQLSTTFETETVFSLNKEKTYTLNLDLIVNDKKVREKIRFKKMSGWCIEMISIDSIKLHADSICMNPIS